MTTAAALRAARLRLHLTQAEAAALVHVTTRAWRAWETVPSRPPNETAAHLFALLTDSPYPYRADGPRPESPE